MRLCCWLSSNDHWPFYAGFEISKKEKGSGDYSSMVSVQEAGWQPVAVVGWHWEKVSQSARTQRCPEDEGNILLETGVCIYFLSQVLGKPIKKLNGDMEEVLLICSEMWRKVNYFSAVILIAASVVRMHKVIFNI